MQPTHFPLPRRFLGPLCAVLAAAALAGCGGGASLPTSTTPVIDAFTANGVAVVFTGTSIPIVAAPTGSATALVCAAHDPNHSPLAFTWSGVNGAVTTSGGVSTATDTPATDGDTLVTCMVTNVRGDTVARIVTVRARAAVAVPLSVLFSPTSATVALGKTDLLTALAVGTTSPTYHFSMVSGKGTVLQSASNPAQATFTAPAAAESDTVLCYVTDTQGRSNTATLVITVQ